MLLLLFGFGVPFIYQYNSTRKVMLIISIITSPCFLSAIFVEQTEMEAEITNSQYLLFLLFLS